MQVNVSQQTLNVIGMLVEAPHRPYFGAEIARRCFAEQLEGYYGRVRLRSAEHRHRRQAPKVGASADRASDQCRGLAQHPWPQR